MMGRSHSYLNNAARIIQAYGGEEPFASFLKKFFSKQKKFGSNDRKQIGHLCYCFFRLGKSLLQMDIEERILVALFLCSKESNPILEELKPGWNEKVQRPTTEKHQMLSLRDGNEHLPVDIFPWSNELSGGVDYEKFCESFLVQPDLFLRLRPGRENTVKRKLSAASIYFKELNSSCLSLPNASKITGQTSSENNIIELDEEVFVQDYNSQRVGECFQFAIASQKLSGEKSKIKAWDCCAASGGKSLLLYDIDPDIDLTVSDIRESILTNLKRRFSKAGIEKYSSYVIDLSRPNLDPDSYRDRTSPKARKGFVREPYLTNFDLIICDAPCTGSGTWSRAPEQLYFFDEQKIDYYASLQRKIILNIVPRLKQNGYLVYVTCSVFKKENERQIDEVMGDLKLELLKMELFKGYDKKADTMFVAVMRKS